MKFFCSLLARIVLTVSVVSLFACAKTVALSDRFKDESAEQIYQAGQTAMRSKYYTDAIDRFEVYDARYPFGERIESVQLDVIYAYYQKGELGSSLAAAKRFIHLHPTSQYVDYAYYMEGLSNFLSNIGTLDKYLPVDFSKRDLTGVRRAFLNFSELARHFPHSRYTPDAIQRMVFLRNLLAEHAYDVGLFYYKHQAYVASANRANQVIRHFQSAPIVPDALALMVKSYDKLMMPTLSADASKVLQYNYSKLGAT